LAILAGGPLVVTLAWPWIAGHVRTAELSVALHTAPREEIVVTGWRHAAHAAAFSLQTLLIEEPGQEPYQRQVSLDADHAFELALGQPREGSYRAALLTGQSAASPDAAERWLRAPELVVEKGRLAPQKVHAQELSYPRLFLIALAVVAMQAALLALWLRLSARGNKASGTG
jgi:hypothetical protein